ncbi:MAG: hypothetical protein V4574_01435 [Pseudomonadota bacterium]
MSASAPDIETVSLGRAMACFGLAVIAIMYATGIVIGLWDLAYPAQYSEPLLAERVADLADSLTGFIIPVVFIALPGALLFGGVLWVGRRASRTLRTLPLWLTAGVVATAPAAGLLWYIDTIFEELENSDPQPPFAWVNLQVPLLILAFGLIAAFAAWRWRGARLAG